MEQKQIKCQCVMIQSDQWHGPLLAPAYREHSLSLTRTAVVNVVESVYAGDDSALLNRRRLEQGPAMREHDNFEHA